jgi:hypothetical protein
VSGPEDDLGQDTDAGSEDPDPGGGHGGEPAGGGLYPTP